MSFLRAFLMLLVVVNNTQVYGLEECTSGEDEHGIERITECEDEDSEENLGEETEAVEGNIEEKKKKKKKWSSSMGGFFRDSETSYEFSNVMYAKSPRQKQKKRKLKQADRRKKYFLETNSPDTAKDKVAESIMSLNTLVQEGEHQELRHQIMDEEWRGVELDSDIVIAGTSIGLLAVIFKYAKRVHPIAIGAGVAASTATAYADTYDELAGEMIELSGSEFDRSFLRESLENPKTLQNAIQIIQFAKTEVCPKKPSKYEIRPHFCKVVDKE